MIKKIILVMFTMLTILTIIIFVLTRPIFTNRAILEKEYTHTKAICNETNFCQDYEIKCMGKKVISLKPITGAAVQHEENWIDPRNSTELCD